MDLNKSATVDTWCITQGSQFVRIRCWVGLLAWAPCMSLCHAAPLPMHTHSLPS